MLKLRFVHDEAKAVWLVEPKVTIGHGAGNDIVLMEPQAPTQQAEILVQHEQLSLRLLQEGVPAFVGGKPIRMGRDYPLSAGDSLKFGALELQVVDPKRERTKVSALPTAHVSRWALVSKHSALSNRRYPIGQSVLVGRATECDISLALSHLSRHHARLEVNGDRLLVEDLDSANGTFVNGKRIQQAELNAGDELRFDSLCFQVVGPEVDLDKTTIRPAPPPANVVPLIRRKAKPSQQGASRSTPAPVLAATRESPESTVPDRSLLWGAALTVLFLLAVALYWGVLSG